MSYSKSKKTYYGNNLNMNELGNARPKNPSKVFNNRRDIITPSATNMSSAPLFYIGPRVNVLHSSINPRSLAIMRFGNNYSLHDVFGNYKVGKGQLMPSKVQKLNMKVDYNGNYKLVDLNGKSHKIYSNSNGNYIKHNKTNMYL